MGIPILTYSEVATYLGIGYDAASKLVQRSQLTPAKKGHILADEKLRKRMGESAYLELVRKFELANKPQANLGMWLATVQVSPIVKAYYLDKDLGVYIAESCSYLAAVCYELSKIRLKVEVVPYGFASVTDMREAVMQHLNGYELSYQDGKHISKKPIHNFKMSNVRRFYMSKIEPFNCLKPLTSIKDVDEYWKKALDSLPSGKLKNQNRAFPEWHEDLVLKIYAGDYGIIDDIGAKPTPKRIHELYCEMLKNLVADLEAEGVVDAKGEYKPMTYVNVHKIVNNMHTRAFHAKTRDGKLYEKEFKPHHHRAKPEVFAILTGDGVSLGRLTKSEDGSTTQKIYAWIWRDWSTGASLGWEFGRGGESSEMMFKSLAKVYQRFGGLPSVVQIDDKVSKKPEVIEMFSRLGIRVMGKEVYNPQSLYAETGNRQMNRIHRAIDPYWVNLTNHKKDFMRKIEEMEMKASEKVRTFPETIEKIETIIAVQNGTPVARLQGKTPLESFAEQLKTNENWQIRATKLDARWAAYYFAGYFKKERTTAVNNGYFKLTTVPGEAAKLYMLKCFASEIPQNDNTFLVRCCWFDEGNEVYVFKVGNAHRKNDKIGDRYLEMCAPHTGYNPDVTSQTDLDKAIIAEQSAQVARFEREKTAHHIEIAENLANLEQKDQINLDFELEKAAHAITEKRKKAGDISQYFPVFVPTNEEKGDTPPEIEETEENEVELLPAKKVNPLFSKKRTI